MKCHYEVLDVPREADQAEIKSAYRKLALRWHPDKNLDDPELAKEQFQLVQQAYEVLSDRQERAWYDNHREQILRGSDSDFEDNSLNVFQYFTTQCFRGYDDDDQGFYAIYRQVFETIVKEDIEYMDSKSDFDEIPSFGFSSSDYDEIVGPFYAYWTSYTTRKSYVWLDPYNIKDTRDRKVSKLMEKENKKVRQKAKKERNEEVRNLVAFVRKRDKRVQAHTKLLEQKIVENRQKQEQLRKQKLMERKQELNNSQPQAEWSKFDNVKSELEEIEKNLAEQFGEELTDSDVSTEDVIDSLYCVACNKVFKTPKAFKNHESSKKHKENVALLKEEMANDDVLSDDSAEDDTEEEISSGQDTSEEDKKSKKKNHRKNKKVFTLRLSHSDDGSNTDFRLDPVASDDDFSFQKKNKKTKTKTKVEAPVVPPVENEETDTQEKKTKKSKDKKPVKLDPGEDFHLHCAVCKSNFPSKNKLYQHLKSSGHSVALPQMSPSSKLPVKKMKKKRQTELRN